MSTAIEFNNVSKQYKLGLVSTKTLSHDLNRWWQTKILGKEDPYLKIGSVNDRSAKADSDYVWALKDIDFKVEQGDVVGIIGKNGAGKSTLLKLLSRVTNPTTGTIRARGRIASLLEVGTGFHPELTGRENIYMNGSIMGMNKAEITRKLDEIVDFSGCERYIDTPVKRYSSGMTVRLGFAIAAHLDPEILVVDEVLAVGDAEFQKKAIGKMQDVSKGEGRTVLFVSHNMASMRQLCTSGVLLENGMVKYIGSIHETIDQYISFNPTIGIKIIDLIKIHSSIDINKIIINNSEENKLFISSLNNELNLQIEGNVDSYIRMAVEARMYDSKNVLLASYCPCHTKGYIYHLSKGQFIIKDKIKLPKFMTSGTYFLEISLTDPGIQFYTTMKQPILLDYSGYTGDMGINLPYSEKGFMLLD